MRSKFSRIIPATDEFDLPSAIIIDVLVRDRSIYTDRLEIVNNENFPNYGTYKCRFDSNKYLEKNHKDVNVLISYGDGESMVELTMISYP